ncbi:putative ABC transporter peptide-binding protein YtcQ [Spirochaetia bacterium]|nr:putative ABC transporter peptide-binding protein YtcQ [Spirochaetia bacterium]
MWKWGGGGKSASQGIKETATPKMYQSSFTPKGPGANVYKEKLDYFSDNFIKFFTDRGEIDKVKGYDTPIKVRVSSGDGAGKQVLLSSISDLYGESLDQNRFTDAIKRAFNVEITHKFISSDYSQQLRLDMAANDLPDIFPVQNQADLTELAKAGVIHDLTGLVAQYNSKYIESCWTDGGNPMVDMATVDGKLYGLPLTYPATDAISYLWVRGDWLTALNLQPPKTMDDLVKIMEAFTNADFDKNGIKDTFGLALGRDIFWGTRGIFTAFSAYPEYWVNKSGALMWGGVDENNKKALAWLADLYKRGFIDKEFVSGKNRNESLIGGKAGLAYGGHWEVSNFQDTLTLDPNADFYTIPIPTADGKPVKSPIAPNTNWGWTAVNKKFANPEIAFKMQSLYDYIYESKDSSWYIFESFSGADYSNGLANWIKVDSPWENTKAFESLEKSYAAGWDESLIGPGAWAWYEALMKPESAYAWERMVGPQYPHSAFYILKDIIGTEQYFWNAYYGSPSTYMQDHWQQIRDEQLVAFTKIITGDLDVNAGFDEWVKNFNSMGGERITREVNDWYKERN